MSISFRQKRSLLSLPANVATQLLFEGDEGTFTNGCDLISVQVVNSGANPIDKIEVYVDCGGYGNNYIIDSAATAIFGSIGPGVSQYFQILPNGWQRFKFIATSVAGTTISITTVGVNSQ